VMAGVGDAVRSGQPLFRVDDRVLRAREMEGEASVQVAEAKLARLKALPRPERIEMLTDSVAGAEAEMNEASTRLERVRRAIDSGAGTADELSVAVNQAAAARARHDEAVAALKLEQAGAWAPDIKIAEADVTQAQGSLRSIRARIDRLTVKAPCDGEILKRNIEPGEAVTAGGAIPAMMIGDMSRLRIRARVDEEDVQGLQPGAAAVARVRGGGFGTTGLSMVRIEPLALNKVDLTGMPAERVDTRVVEVLFDVEDAPELVLYPGMLVDVFIESSRRDGDAASESGGP